MEDARSTPTSVATNKWSVVPHPYGGIAPLSKAIGHSGEAIPLKTLLRPVPTLSRHLRARYNSIRRDSSPFRPREMRQPHPSQLDSNFSNLDNRQTREDADSHPDRNLARASQQRAGLTNSPTSASAPQSSIPQLVRFNVKMNPEIRAAEILREQAMGRKISKSIAIQRPPRPKPTSDDEEAATISSSMYDWATWRMYNRIVDHRQKHPVRHSVFNDVDFHIPGTGGVAPPIARPIATLAGSATPPLLEDDYLEGEVFEIEV